MPELMVELLTEDIPARMQAKAAEDFRSLMLKGLKEAGLPDLSAHATAHSTPRRLSLSITDVPPATQTTREERRGPRDGAPDKAIEGFLKGNGLTSLDQAERRETPKGVFWFAIIETPGRQTVDLLPGVIVDAIRAVPWPKSMRWASGSFRWVRPLSAIIAVFDGTPLNGALDRGKREEPLAFTNQTVGHRFLGPEPITVTHFAPYRDALRAARVILDREERKQAILERAEALAAAEGLRLKADSGLLEEVAGLVEWPVPLLGSIDQEFMEVPPEVLVTSMRTHQKYFACETADGQLAPRFVVVANMAPTDGGKTIVSGNERVLRARLSDARFFWDKDRAIGLEERLPSLARITFHAKLGTVADRVERLETLARFLATRTGANGDQAARAARLSKSNLVTDMVGEFPELQGLMGRYYALGAGEPAAVADALAAQYSPAGPADTCPTEPVSVALALAEKIDTLVGFFAIDERPTGSKDPYALRRAALGVIRLVLENGLTLDLTPILEEAHRLYAAPLSLSAADTAEALLGFLADRMTVQLRAEGIRHDMVSAAVAVAGARDLVALKRRAEALQTLIGTEDGTNLLTAYRRAANIVRAEEKKGPLDLPTGVDAGLFAQAEESALATALAATRVPVAQALAGGDDAGAMSALATLRAPLDAFFDQVTVNADEPRLRLNRLALLRDVQAQLNQTADFSRIEG